MGLDTLPLVLLLHEWPVIAQKRVKVGLIGWMLLALSGLGVNAGSDFCMRGKDYESKQTTL